MGFYRGQLDIQNAADLGIAFIGAHQAQHLQLGGGHFLAGGQGRHQEVGIPGGLHPGKGHHLPVPALFLRAGQGLQQGQQGGAAAAYRADEPQPGGNAQGIGKALLPGFVL